MRRFFPDKTVDQFREIRIGLDEDIANEWQGLSSSDAQIAYGKKSETMARSHINATLQKSSLKKIAKQIRGNLLNLLEISMSKNGRNS